MKFPSLVRKGFCETPVHVELYGEGLTEDGAPETVFEADLLCNWQDAAKTVLTKEQKSVVLVGSALFTGDICPALPVISGGTVTAFGEKRVIAKGAKARNPDGTVNYTRLDVI